MSLFDERQIQAVLFDLDGTLVDTAPDMVAALQEMQLAHDLQPVPYEVGRANVSNGAIGLLSVGFPDANVKIHSSLHLEYLERYEQRLCVDSAIFPGLDSLLDDLEAAKVPWGIVTNKPEHLTQPLLTTLELASRSACNVSGDTLPERKPHPAPMFHACELIKIAPTNAVYVGDSARDIEAGRAAGMATIAAAYGYITDDDDPSNWGADKIVTDTRDLAKLVLKAVTL